jgi:hypothetical protein
MIDLNPFAGIFPLPPPKTTVLKATATEQYRFVKKDRSKCAARVADLRTIHGDGHLQPLDIIAAYYISDHTSDSYVFSIQELESVRMAMLLGRPTPDFGKTIVKRIDAIWTELLSLAFEPSNGKARYRTGAQR